jgi:hypothetical protein
MLQKRRAGRRAFFYGWLHVDRLSMTLCLNEALVEMI